MLPKDVEQVLIGSLFGDGSILFQQGCCNACFREGHSLKQTDYLNWKAGVLSCFGSRVMTHEENGYKTIDLTTHVHPILTELRHLWYPNGSKRKVMPEGAVQKLEPLGLAVWYQDDGTYSYQCRWCKIALQGFENRADEIKGWFREKWGLDTTSSSHALVFTIRSTDQFLRLIADHVRPSMVYKLGHLHPANLAKLEESHKRLLDWKKRYRHENKDEIKLYRMEYYKKNREGAKQYAREYYWEHHDERLKYACEWRARNRGGVASKSESII